MIRATIPFSRRVRCGCALVALVLSAGCTKDPARPFPPPPTYFPPVIDDYPAWSHDGLTIAYLRFYESADGPPGIYLIGRWGGNPRLLVPGPFWAFRFSPDDRYLVGVTFTVGTQLAIIDVADGSVIQPLAVRPGRAVDRPGWSLAGDRLVYARGWNPSEPPDSGGLHIFDLRTREDRPIRGAGTILIGGEPMWLPTGQISFIGLDDMGREQLTVVDPDGANARALYTSRGGDSFWSHHWYDRPAAGLRGILFTDNDPQGGTFLASPDGPAIARFTGVEHQLIGWDHEAFSPDGEWLLHHGFDPLDSLDVLYVTKVGDHAEATTYQLTKYSPPPEKAEASPAAWREAAPPTDLWKFEETRHVPPPVGSIVVCLQHPPSVRRARTLDSLGGR